MRKIIVYIAASADGFIARPDGDVAWLDRPDAAGDYGMKAFYKTIDTVVMGRKTWSVGKRLGQASFPGVTNYVFSRTPRKSALVKIVGGPVGPFAQRLRRAKGKNVWLVGGAQLIAGFLDAAEVDELVIHVIPVLIGAGIPLVAPRRRSIELRLLSTRTYKDGGVRLRYAVARVRKPTSSGANRKRGSR